MEYVIIGMKEIQRKYSKVIAIDSGIQCEAGLLCTLYIMMMSHSREGRFAPLLGSAPSTDVNTVKYSI